MKVPWIPKERIEHSALGIIADYQDMIGHTMRTPIPVEDIIERYLKVNLSFEDLEEKLGMEDVLGATFVKPRLICINEKLLENNSEGRLRFTCAHEVGHWVLHRQFINVAAKSGPQKNDIICRIKNSRHPIEWQADYFAACLLMPEKETINAFCKVCGTEALVVDNVRSSFGSTSLYIDPCIENWPYIAAMVCEAGGFNVSKQAMVIRLMDLRLLVNLTKERIGWSKSYCTAR
jgi:Zn-dependent peptidase ImmA (M78 family)